MYISAERPTARIICGGDTGCEIHLHFMYIPGCAMGEGLNENLACKPCDIGTYREEEGVDLCKECGINMTTFYENTNSSSLCTGRFCFILKSTLEKIIYYLCIYMHMHYFICFN